MGYTPLAGVVMGTRTGDIDASVVTGVMNATGQTAEEVISTFNKKSGLYGLCGYSDMRDIEEHIDELSFVIIREIVDKTINGTKNINIICK